MRIKKGDTVLVIAGKNKGTKGDVLVAFPKDGKVLVSGVNVVTKHVKKTAEAAGQKIQKELPIDVSNVMLLDGEGKVSRVKYSENEKGKKVRVFTTTQKEVVENFKKA
nr:ribosomal protein L24 [uncultured bacterium]